MLHFYCGKAGSGKTTAAIALSRDLPAVFLCEDEWIQKLVAEPITHLHDYIVASRRVRHVMGPLIVSLLRFGNAVVLDFAGNTRPDRRWVRGLADAAKKPHLLHVIDRSDEECLAAIARRNAERPEGVFFGEVSPALFAEVTKYFTHPTADEGLSLA